MRAWRVVVQDQSDQHETAQYINLESPHPQVRCYFGREEL